MDRIIKLYNSVEDKDLEVLPDYGIAYQADMGIRIAYDLKYFKNYQARSKTPEALKIMASRMSLMSKYLGRNDRIIEIGIGCGQFMETVPYNAVGYDINPVGVEWLKNRNQYFDINKEKDFLRLKGWCLWDVLEHIDEPELLFKLIPDGAFVFCSIPIIQNIMKVRESKHYKPGEHLYYFTLKAFIDWMWDWGFSCEEIGADESLSGRDNVYSFVFKKSLPSGQGLLEQYHEIHETRPYGETSIEFINEVMRAVAKMDFKSIIDWGCGRSDLMAYLYGDGKRTLDKYDPAIPKYNITFNRKYDLVICTDVLEHIWKRDLEAALKNIRDLSINVLFSVATVPARKKLPCGINAHVTVMPEKWWTEIITRYFENCHKIRDYGAGFLCKTF